MSISGAPPITFEPRDDIAAIVAKVAKKTPDQLAVACGPARASYSDLDARLTLVAKALVASGFQRGNRIAVLASNSLEYVEIFFGALRAGLSVVPLPNMATSDALSRMLDDSGAKALFTSSAYVDSARAALGERPLLRVGIGFSDPSFVGYSDFLEMGRAGAFEPATIRADDEFDVIYSSGTTGVPKGIVHSHGARKASYSGSRATYFGPSSVNLITTPFYSNTTCITWLLTTAAGGTNVVLDKFSPDAFFDAVREFKGTHAMLVPIQYERLLGSPRFCNDALTSVSHLFSTSAPLREAVKRRVLRETHAELIEIYGLTEGGPVTVLEARQHEDKLASVGRAPSGSEIRVVDEQGREVPAGQTGEVLGRSANMMSGYLNRPDDTAEIRFVAPDGMLFHRSGDIGRKDEDGFLYLLDRKKDVIISGGFNVYACDLEAVLATHPDVSEVAVIGVPSTRWGETPLALVVLADGSDVGAEALKEYCNAKVGKAQRVSDVVLRTELPKSAVGKVLKRELRSFYAERAQPH